MSAINRVPYGFLALWDAKNVGKTPDQVADYVQPMIDVESYYLAGALKVAAPAGVTVTTAITTTSVTVPSGEAWRVVGISAVGLSLTAAVLRVGFAVSVQPAGSTGDCVVLDLPTVSSVAITDRFYKGVQNPPLVLMPGSVISAINLAVNAANSWDLLLRVMYHQLPI